MNKRKFVLERQKAWRRFGSLIDQAGTKQSRKQMSGAQLVEYSRLLREVSNDLAIIRARNWGQELADYVNTLVTRGYNNYYTSPPGHVRQLIRFLLFGYPRLCRANWPYMLTAWCLFFVPFLVSWGIIQTDPSLASRVLPKAQLEQMEQMYEEPFFAGNTPSEAETGEPRNQLSESARDDLIEGDILAEGYLDQRSFMAGFYVKNNVGIAFRSFAVGILFGVATCYVLLSNGLIIGSSFGYTIAAGHGENLLSFVVTHGSFELTAIAIAGGAGLMLGDAIVHRANRTWVDSLKVRGLDAMKIAFGAGVMLVVAALIEAFWSPAPIDPQLKYVVGGAGWVLVYAWLLLAGRGNRR